MAERGARGTSGGSLRQACVPRAGVPADAVLFFCAAVAMAALSGGQKAKALYDYEARAQDELSFKRHEIITVLGKDEEDEGWYIGTSSSGAKGLFPVNYVSVLGVPAK